MELFFITLSTFSINFLLGRLLRLRSLDIILSFTLHYALTFLSISFVVANGGDAEFYYYASKLSIQPFNMYYGGNFIVDLVGIFSRFLNLNYVNTTFLFSSLGLSGIFIFSKIIKDLLVNLPNRYKLIYYLILFSPSLHFWSSLIGKDNLCLFFISFSIFSIINICKYKAKIYWLLLLISLSSIFLIRPHFSLIITAGISVNLIFILWRKTYFGLIMFIFTLILAFFGLDFLFSYIKSTYAYKGNISEVLSQMSTIFATTADNTFQVNYTPGLSELRYILAPLPTLKGGIFGIISGIELIPYFLIFLKPIIISLRIILNFNFQRIIRFIKNNYLITSLFIIPIFFTIILSATSYNLGVVIRQRTVITPFYIIPFLIYIRFVNGLKPLGVDGFKST